MKKIEAYQCDYCNKIARTVSGIKSHEAHCHSNPQFKCCENCTQGCLKLKLPENYNPNALFCEGNYEPYCKAYERFVFGEGKDDRAYFLECDTRGYHEEAPVPYTCWSFASKGRHGFEIEEDELNADKDI